MPRDATIPPDAQAVLGFWFDELDAKQHFAKDDALDALIKDHFITTLQAAMRGELAHWRTTPEGRLAEIIVLDQFSRNVWRDTPQAFSQDPQALTLAQELAASDHWTALAAGQRAFAWLPFMHSESLLVHRQAEALFDQPGLENTRSFERGHRAILERFGRYPHRNAALARISTEEETAFLAQPGSSY